MKKSHLAILSLFLILAAACSSEKKAGAPSPMLIPSLTASPSRTLAPTLTATPSPTQMPTLTQTPSPTLTITPYVGEVLPVITNPPTWWQNHNTPVPVVKPESEWQAYQLRDWTEADAFALIRSLELYAHQNDGMGAAHGRLDSLPSTYGLVELAIRELLYRFSETENREALNWRLALAKNLQGETDLDEWMLEKIEEYLNLGLIVPANLNTLLLEQGYMVAEEWSAPRLFGDASDVQVYRVQAIDGFGDGGVVFALRKQKQSGVYEVFHIFSEDAPGTLATIDRIVDVQDHNKNGIPEVVIETGASSGSMCSLHVLSYEWRDGLFIDLTRGEISSWECLDWSFSEPDYYGIDTITVNQLGLGGYEKYAWNGRYYELEDIILSRSPMDCTDFYGLLGAWSDYDRGITALQNVVQEWSDEYDSKFGGICRDYLRFQIGLEYALHNRRSNARMIFQDLVDSPTDPTMPIFSTVAQTFLASYNTQQDIYLGCLNAQAAYEDAFPSPQENQPEFWEHFPVCSWLFPTLFQSTDFAQVSDPVSWLQEKGVTVIASSELDVDGDGDPDWLVAISESKSQPDVWVLLNTDQGLHPYDVTVYRSYNLSGPDAFKVNTIIVPGTDEVLVVLDLEEDIKIFQIGEVHDGETVRGVFFAYYVQDIEFSETDLGWMLEVSEEPLSEEPHWSDFYLWDDQLEKFLHLPFYDNELFTENAFDDSLPYLERLVAYLHANPDSEMWEKERYLYLLGVAYELSGESEKAVQLYWEIWRDYPETAYARMACTKIAYCLP